MCKELGHEVPILKDTQEQAMKLFMSDSIYSKSFAGLSKLESDKIKAMLLTGIAKGRNPDLMLKSIMQIAGKNFPKNKAGGILWGEYQAITNKAREWSFRQSDPKGTEKYRWLSTPDNRRTKTCERISSRTSKGVTLDRLNQIIKEEMDRSKKLGELDKSFEGRDYQPHYLCRSTYVRHFGKR